MQFCNLVQKIAIDLPRTCVLPAYDLHTTCVGLYLQQDLGQNLKKFLDFGVRTGGQAYLFWGEFGLT